MGAADRESLGPTQPLANGNPVRPEDVIFSLSRAVKLNRAPVFIRNELGWNAGNLDGYLSKIDPRHVRVSWSAPVGPTLALNILTAPAASIIDTREVLAHAVGDADIARDLGPDQIAALSADSQVRTLSFPAAKIDYLMFKAANSANPALRNPALWEAARWLIDYDGIATTPYHLDVAGARAILAAAGIEPGLRITLDVFNQPPYGQIAQSLQASFAQAGITLDIVRCRLDGERVRTESRGRREDARLARWLAANCSWFEAARESLSAASISRRPPHRTGGRHRNPRR